MNESRWCTWRELVISASHVTYERWRKYTIHVIYKRVTSNMKEACHRWISHGVHKSCLPATHSLPLHNHTHTHAHAHMRFSSNFLVQSPALTLTRNLYLSHALWLQLCSSHYTNAFLNHLTIAVLAPLSLTLSFVLVYTSSLFFFSLSLMLTHTHSLTPSPRSNQRSVPKRIWSSPSSTSEFLFLLPPACKDTCVRASCMYMCMCVFE